MHPSPYPITTHARPVPLRGLSTAASTTVWVAAAGMILMAASTPTFGWSQKHVQAQIGMGLMSVGLLVGLVGQLVAGIVVIVWLHRARANADVLYPATHRMAAGWAIGGWFVPIGNLFIPVSVVTDVVKASNPTGQSIPQVGLWWAGWIGGNLALPIGVGVVAATGPYSAPRTLAIFVVLSALLYVLAAFAFRKVAMSVAQWQDERMAYVS